MFQLHLTLGFPRAPLTLEFPPECSPRSSLSCRRFESPARRCREVFDLGNAECGSLPRQRDQRSSDFPQGAEGLLPGTAALPEEDTAEGAKAHFPMINAS